MQQTAIQILSFKPEYAPYFKRFNEEWIQDYFRLEPLDIYVLEHPEEAILKDGGKILFAQDGENITGTVALKWIDDTTVELTKMAVGSEYRGNGAGPVLCKAAIATAKEMGATTVILYSNTRQAAAIKIYRKLGFIEIPLEQGVYERANIKMKLPLTDDAAPEKWFDRKFDFDLGMEQYDTLYQRLQAAPGIFENQLAAVSETILQNRYNDKWSIKENIGHLFLLEFAWQIRLAEIADGKAELLVIDLNNSATDESDFNAMPLQQIMRNFREIRLQTISFLDTLTMDAFAHSSLHPRLKQPMCIIDMMYFIAEHDRHHLHTIQNILKRYNL